MDSILRDFRYGLKALVRDRAFSLTVLITLGVCLGANIAVFSVVQNVVLSPLPFRESHRLVAMYNLYPGAGLTERNSNSTPDYFFRRERVDGLQEVAAYQSSGSIVGEAGSTERISSLRVTPSFFPMLGVEPALGRVFLEEELDRSREPTALLTHGYWQERLGGAADVIGQSLWIDGQSATIVGVLEEDFRMPDVQGARILLPLSFSAQQRTLEAWHANSWDMLGRLAPGATVEQVEAQIAALNSSLIDDCPLPDCRQLLHNAGFHTVVVNAQDDLVRNVKPVLFLLWGGAAFVLLIGCVNIANLMLVRSQVRVRELATRMALGAQRGRLARQILTEALVMSLGGGTLGLGLAAVGLRLLVVGIEDLPRGVDVGLNAPVLVYALALAVGACVLFGTIPIAHLFRTDLNGVFREEGRTGTANRAAILVRGSLVTGQVALAFLLLVGAGLMLRSFRAALDIDPGFEPEGVLTGYLSLPSARYTDGDAQRRFADELLPHLRRLPGVTAAGITSQLPFGSGGDNVTGIVIPEGYQPEPGESFLAPWSTAVAPGYFEAMGIDILAGRGFEDRDTQDQPRRIIIDEWLARRYWPDRSPLGQRMATTPPGEEPDESDLYTVIGVVESVKQYDLTAEESGHVGAAYFTYQQRPIRLAATVVRTAGDPRTLAGSVRAVVTRLDPELPLFDIRTLDERLSESLASRRTPMILLLVFAGIALFLAVVGIYGVLAYSVGQRTREIGIRMALGGQARDILGLVLKDGLILIGVGLTIGTIGAFFLVRLIQSLLFGVQATDPIVLVATAGLLGLAAVSACLIPARRATRVNPVVALVKA